MCCCNDLDFRFAEGCYIQGKLLHRNLWQWQSEKYIQYSETVFAEQVAKCDMWMRKIYPYQTYINLAMINLIFKFKS